MKEIIIGIVSGIFTGVGMGGGTILIFLLTNVFGKSQHIAQATNLIFFIPTSISSIIVNFKNKKIDIKLGVEIVIFGIIGTLVGANISRYLNVNILKKFFGFFLIIIAINEIISLVKMNKKN